MDNAVTAALLSFGAVALAEMGDKTQLLAMAFAARYKAAKVLLGVFIATVLINAMGVAAGSWLAHYRALAVWVQAAASLSFIVFGLWSLRGEKQEDGEKRKGRFGPVLTVAIAFFVAELGDKTQLAAIALAAKFPAHPAFVLLGAVAGMTAVNALGVFVGASLCRRIPEKIFRIASAAVFGLFGFWGVWQTASEGFGWNAAGAACAVAVVALIAGIIAWRMLRRGIPNACD
jgi:putative Ca2+/H+ antiporter (TMEM165/GDT1 family)